MHHMNTCCPLPLAIHAASHLSVTQRWLLAYSKLQRRQQEAVELQSKCCHGWQQSLRESDDAGIFTAAHALAPSVILIDELDALAPARGGGDSEGGGGGGMAPEPAAEMCGRIVSSLLTAMDGINSHPASAGQPPEPPTALDISVSWKCSKLHASSEDRHICIY